MSGFVNPLVPSGADWLTFVRSYMGIAPAYLPDDSPWIGAALSIATTQVNLWLQAAAPANYTLAVYNYAADRLLRIALDEPGQIFFSDIRKSIGIHGFSAGVIQSSSDAGSSQSMAVPEWSKLMTVTDIEMSRTSYGRTYLGLAQDAGPVIWGLS